MTKHAYAAALLLSVVSCSEGAPPEPLSARSAVAAPTDPDGADGYFSICESHRPVEERMVTEAALSDRVVVVGLVVPGGDVPGMTRRFRTGSAELEYPTRRITVTITRVLHDPAGRVRGPGSEVHLLVTDPSRARRIERSGRVFLPFPGTTEGRASDHNARSDGEGTAFLIEVLNDELYVTETARISAGRILGERASIPLESFSDAVAFRRASRRDGR